MCEFLKYWTMTDYILLAVLLSLTIAAIFFAIQAEKEIKRTEADRARMSPQDLIATNEAMQHALEQWERSERASQFLEHEARKERLA